MKTQYYFFFWVLSLFMLACESPQPSDPALEIETYFAKNPPIADKIQLRLEKSATGVDQVIILAHISDNMLDKNRFSMALDDNQIIDMRDDGKGFDQVAGDGIFSGLSNISLDMLTGMANEYNLQLQSSQTQQVHMFRGRRSTEITTLGNFNLEGFLEGAIIDIFPGFPLDEKLLTHALFINDLGVIEDPGRTYNPCTGVGTPMGAWTFGRLMTEMANESVTGVSASDFVLNWLASWDSDQTVNGDLLHQEDMQVRIRRDWLAASRANGLPEGVLDMSIAPFRLLAIVNRVDLRENTAYGGTNAGEARFVFGNISQSDCRPNDHITILEFGIEKIGCLGIKGWAKQWYDLRELEIGSPRYNAELQNITDQFTRSNAAPRKANGSALNQLRTNKGVVGVDAWDFREFHIDAETHHLKNVVVAQTPQSKYIFNRNAARIAEYINAQESDILDNTYEIPASFSGDFFQGGRAGLEGAPGERPTVWDGSLAWTTTSPVSQPGMVSNHEARHIFSLNSCNGCHGSESGTFFKPFHMINNLPFGERPTLSGFLTGVGGPPELWSSVGTPFTYCVPDPLGRPVSGSDPCPDTPEIERGFNDLLRRAQDLNDLVHTLCEIERLFFRPVNMAH